MDKQYIEFDIKAGDNIEIVASDETKDRHGDVIPVDSWDLSKFKTAPRLLVDHDHRVEKIVGKANKMRIEKATKKRLVFEAIFHGITELSRQVEEMVRAGFLNTVSVGFIPHPPEKEGDTGKNELIEVSFVTVPANPSARVIKGLLDEDEEEEAKEKITEFVEEKEFTGEITVKQSEVQTLIFSKKKFSQDESVAWAKDHGFKARKVDETENSFRIRQFEAEECQEGTPRTITLDTGIRAVTCKKVKSVDTDETTQKQECPDGYVCFDESISYNVIKIGNTLYTKTPEGNSSQAPSSKRAVVASHSKEHLVKEAVKHLNRALQLQNKRKTNRE